METKPSLYTTEFWFHLLLQLFFTLNTAQAWTYMPQKWSGIAQAMIFFGYTLSRGIAKSKGSFDPNLKANHKLFPKASDMKHR